MTKPKVFIASSTEGKNIANKINTNLDYDCEVTVWDVSYFELTSSVFDSILQSIEQYDFGIFVFSPDDVVKIRGEEKKIVRDNVLLEFGIFVGKLGKERNFIVKPRGDNFHIPTDILGVIPTTFEPNRDDKNLRAALNPACDEILERIKELQSSEPNNINDLITTCPEDILIQQENPLEEDSIFLDDRSNLNYLLLSVVDCVESRKILKEIQLDVSQAEFDSFQLAGMYDVMGKWDLLVRFRLSQDANLPRLQKLIGDKLTERGQIKKKTTLFGLKVIDVKLEIDYQTYLQSDSIKKIINELNITNNLKKIKHRRLISTEEYDKQRCQRAFMYVLLPRDPDSSLNLINSLKTKLSSQNAQEVEPIIESISISENEIIFEIFMRCSQTNLLNKFNRLIEECIPIYEVQKYTLLCFAYDEPKISIENQSC